MVYGLSCKCKIEWQFNIVQMYEQTEIQQKMV